MRDFAIVGGPRGSRMTPDQYHFYEWNYDVTEHVLRDTNALVGTPVHHTQSPQHFGDHNGNRRSNRTVNLDLKIKEYTPARHDLWVEDILFYTEINCISSPMHVFAVAWKFLPENVQDDLLELRRMVRKEQPINAFELLVQELTRKFQPETNERIIEIIRHTKLGQQLPSQFYALLRRKATNLDISEDVIHCIFESELPENLKLQLKILKIMKMPWIDILDILDSMVSKPLTSSMQMHQISSSTANCCDNRVSTSQTLTGNESDNRVLKLLTQIKEKTDDISASQKRLENKVSEMREQLGCSTTELISGENPQISGDSDITDLTNSVWTEGETGKFIEAAHDKAAQLNPTPTPKKCTQYKHKNSLDNLRTCLETFHEESKAEVKSTIEKTTLNIKDCTMLLTRCKPRDAIPEKDAKANDHQHKSSETWPALTTKLVFDNYKPHDHRENNLSPDEKFGCEPQRTKMRREGSDFPYYEFGRGTTGDYGLHPEGG